MDRGAAEAIGAMDGIVGSKEGAGVANATL